METELSIGALAAQAGVNVETIRYYQRRNLLKEPQKPHAGHRRYPRSMVNRLRFIKRAQALGFTLDEVASLLQLDQARACGRTYELASHKVEVIDGKLADLKAMRKALTRLSGQCRPANAAPCPIISALAAD